MKDSDDNNIFMITKEEVIKIRSLYLEFGDKKIQEKRLLLPYENIEIEDYCLGYKVIDLLDILSFYQFGNLPHLLGLEFLLYIELENGINWRFDVFNFVNDIEPKKLKRKLLKRFQNDLKIELELKDNIVGYFIKKDSGIENNVLEDNQLTEKIIRETIGIKDEEILYKFLNKMYIEKYKDLSDNELFSRLRNGLWYKKFDEIEKAIFFLEKARKLLMNSLSAFVMNNLDYHNRFDDKIKRLEENKISTSPTFPDFYKDWWLAQGSITKIPIELQLAAEETPSFQLAEIYMKRGERKLKDNNYQKAEKDYLQALEYFQEVSEYLNLNYFINKKLEEYIKKIENQEKTDADFVKAANLTKKQVKLLLDLLSTPLYLPLSVRSFQRNPYLEKNLQVCVNALEKINFYYKTAVITRDIQKDYLKGEIETIVELNLLKKTKQKTSIEDYNRAAKKSCEENYSKIMENLSRESRMDLIKSKRDELITTDSDQDFKNSIMSLSRLSEREIEITLRRLKKNYNLSDDFKDRKIYGNFYGMKLFLENFGEDILGLKKEEISILVKQIKEVGELRNLSAHDLPMGGFGDYSRFVKILMGPFQKEQESLIYKIINFRYV